MKFKETRFAEVSLIFIIALILVLIIYLV